MRITSIRERPEYIPALLTSLRNIGPPACPGSKSTWRKSSAPAALCPTPTSPWRRARWWEGYTLAYKEILWSTDTGLWIATLYVDPGFRGST